MVFSIVGYDQVDPAQVLELNLLGLGYPLTAERATRLRSTEERLAPWMALYAVEDGLVIGQVGAMRVTLETRNGPEDFGALWAVCTRPDRTGQGVATRLVAETHRRFGALGLRHSLLTTSRERVAHHLYERLGYRDLVVFGQVMALPLAAAAPPAAGAPAELQPVPAGDRESIFRIYSEATADHLGFAHRSRRFAEAAAAAGDASGPAGDVTSGGFLVVRPPAAGAIPDETAPAVGYVVVEPGREVVRILEAVTLPSHDLALTLAAVRRAFPRQIVVYRGILTGEAGKAVGRAGFGSVVEGPGVLMVADLGVEDPPGPDLGRLRETLGMDEELFFFGGLDST